MAANSNYFHMSRGPSGSQVLPRTFLSEFQQYVQNTYLRSRGPDQKQNKKKGTQAYKWRREFRDLFGPESLGLLEICGIDVIEVAFFCQLNSAVTSNFLLSNNNDFQ